MDLQKLYEIQKKAQELNENKSNLTPDELSKKVNEIYTELSNTIEQLIPLVKHGEDD